MERAGILALRMKMPGHFFAVSIWRPFSKFIRVNGGPVQVANSTVQPAKARFRGFVPRLAAFGPWLKRATPRAGL